MKRNVATLKCFVQCVRVNIGANKHVNFNSTDWRDNYN